jgi:hypothetical protein
MAELNSITRKSNQNRNINYLSKDFASFRDNLIEYSKTYFPKTFSDFNESSPGMVFIEMASYVGDVLSYYIDDTLKESLMLYAEDRDNVIALSEYLGYKPKVTSPAITKMAVYQTLPASGSGSDIAPDPKYYLRIKEGMSINSPEGIRFRTTEELDFNDDTDREITVFQKDGSRPITYLVKKYINAISAEVRTITKSFGSNPQSFSRIDLPDTNVIDIYDIRDSNGNKWYKVPYLAQEMVYVDYPNNEQYDKDLSQFKDSVPSILKLIKTSRRFTTKVNPDNTTSIVFGGGVSTDNDELLIPNLKNVGLGLTNSISRLGESFDPANFLRSNTYGQAPTGEFTVSYLVGGGVSSNVPKGELTSIQTIEFDEDLDTFTPEELTLYNRSKNSVAVENETPGTGGRGADTIEEIRENALANFGSQNRAVTRKDYQVRALSLPTKFGGVSKAYCAPDGELDNNSPSSILADPESLQQFTDLVRSFVEKPDGEEPTEQEIKDEVRKYLVGKTSNVNEKNNPFAINLYVLGYNNNKKLSTLNRAVKENLKTYMNEFRMMTDGVNLLDGFIINIGVDFEIRTYGNYNRREVLTRVIQEVKEYFNIDDWTFNMTINLSELELLIAGVEGVQSVPKLEVFNKCQANHGSDYSEHSYNIKEATKNKLVYPSLDPSVFELKFPDKDIQGRVV